MLQLFIVRIQEGPGCSQRTAGFLGVQRTRVAPARPRPSFWRMDMNHNLLTLDVEQLADTLKLTARTVRLNLSRAPERLPPRVRNSRRPIWRVVDVENWLAGQSSTPASPLTRGGKK